MSEFASISFTHYGAVPSKSNFRKGSKGWRKSWERIKAFQEAIGWLALKAGANPRYKRMPVEVHARLIGQKLDVDNAGKAILDGLEGVCYEDDSQVFGWQVFGVHEEYPCSPRVEIKVKWHTKVPAVNSGRVEA